MSCKNSRKDHNKQKMRLQRTLPDEKVKIMSPVQRSRYDAYQPPKDEKGIKQCKKRLHEYAIKTEKEKVLLPKINSHDTGKNTDISQQMLVSKCRIRSFRNIAQKNEETALHRILASQRSAAQGCQLEALLSPQLKLPKSVDSVSKRQRIRIESLLEDDSGREVARILCD